MMGCSEKFQFQTSFAFALNILSLSSSNFGLLIGGKIHRSVGIFCSSSSSVFLMYIPLSDPYSPDRYLDHRHP